MDSKEFTETSLPIPKEGAWDDEQQKQWGRESRWQEGRNRRGAIEAAAGERGAEGAAQKIAGGI